LIDSAAEFFNRTDTPAKSVAAVSVISPPKHQKRAIATSEIAPPPPPNDENLEIHFSHHSTTYRRGGESLIKKSLILTVSDLSRASS